MRFNLSSMRILIADMALAAEKTFSGSRAESPYASFFETNSFSSALHLLFILLSVVI
jgi:hypothetical protein